MLSVDGAKLSAIGAPRADGSRAEAVTGLLPAMLQAADPHFENGRTDRPLRQASLIGGFADTSVLLAQEASEAPPQILLSHAGMEGLPAIGAGRHHFQATELFVEI